jgi:hypothetical protein
MSLFNVVSNNTSGYCVEYTGDGTGIFCLEHMQKAPFFVARGVGDFAPASVLDRDRDIYNLFAVEVRERRDAKRHVICGHAFQPCPNSEEPSPSGVCETACHALSIHYRGNLTVCAPNLVVDDTEDKEVLCGSASQTTVNRGALIAMVAAAAINTLALVL